MKPYSLRSAVRRTGKWSAGGETKERSRSATTVAEPQTEARRACGILRMQLVTSARFVERNGHGRAGKGADRSPWSGANRALVTATRHFAKDTTNQTSQSVGQ